MNLKDYCQQAARIAASAGAEILKVYEGEIEVELKDDDSPLTLADKASHNEIVAGLQQLDSSIPVLSEEGAQIDFITRSSWSTYWLIDPLDGTKEFIKRNGEFTVNIALVEKGVPILGVVYVPVTGITYFSWQGGGSWRQQANAEPVRLEVKRALPGSALTVVCSRSHRGERLDQLLDRLGEYEALPTGSSLKLCMVAEGSADFYPRLGPTSEWDTAAAHAVVLGAGGVVLDLNLEPLVYNQKDSLLNPEFLVMPEAKPAWLPDLGGL